MSSCDRIEPVTLKCMMGQTSILLLLPTVCAHARMHIHTHTHTNTNTTIIKPVAATVFLAHIRLRYAHINAHNNLTIRVRT